jgi:hypothetical protein
MFAPASDVTSALRLLLNHMSAGPSGTMRLDNPGDIDWTDVVELGDALIKIGKRWKGEKKPLAH